MSATANDMLSTVGLNQCREANGGEGGIRTPDGVAPMPHFECGAFNHSATSPRCAALKTILEESLSNKHQ